MDKKRITIYELAKVCGVSTATVSRVVNGRKNVRPETRDLIYGQMQRLDYHPSAAARALSIGRSRVVSVWIGNLKSPYVMAFLGELEQHLAQVKFEMTLRNLWRRTKDEALPPGSADGIIVVDEPHWIEWLRNTPSGLRTPIVSLGKQWAKFVDHVGLDLAEGTRESVEHLIAVGCKRVAYVSPAMRNNLDDIQYRTYLCSVGAAGRTAEVIETPWISNRIKVEETMEAYLAQHECPDGLLCHNDEHAIAVYRTLRRHGLRVPEEVAVVGRNGLEETEYLEHPLSTIVLPVAEACKAAWDMLENRMRNPELPLQSIILKPKLHVRASSTR